MPDWKRSSAACAWLGQWYSFFFKWLILLFPFSLVADSSRAAWCQGHHNLNAWREIPLKISVRVALLSLLFPQRNAVTRNAHDVERAVDMWYTGSHCCCFLLGVRLHQMVFFFPSFHAALCGATLPPVPPGSSKLIQGGGHWTGKVELNVKLN